MTLEQALQVLAQNREKIDAIDRQLVELLNRRTRIVEEIGRAKEAVGMPIYEPKREDDVYRNILSHNAGPLSPGALRRIYERVIDEMRSLQHLNIAAGSAKARPDGNKGGS
ncbi:MAG TPA: chorismate mutase [Bryobacteraceae bacterium]|nr:chorismate mutase [Bryobacteraceae bacterium]